MDTKTPRDEYLHKTWVKEIRILMVLIIFSIIILSGEIRPASAYTAPYRLMVFTDKQVYLDFAYTIPDAGGPPTASVYTANANFTQDVTLYALLLDSDGNIVRSGLAGSNFSATLKDTALWNHTTAVPDPYINVIPTNGAYYSGDFPAFTDLDGDGIYSSNKSNTPMLQLGTQPALTDHLNISLNVTVSYQGINYTSNVSVIFGNAGCRHPTNAITNAHAKSNHDDVPCTVCHWGYQYNLGIHGPNNSAMYNDIARYTGTPAWTTYNSAPYYDYRLGYRNSTAASPITTWDNSNGGYCVMCHGGPLNRNILDLGVGSAPSNTDQNGDGLPDDNRPSCSWYQGPLGNNSAYPGCHGPAYGSNGSTKIAVVQLFNVDWKGWSQRFNRSKAHNHSSPPNTIGAPCELCHAGGGAPGTGTGGLHSVGGLPNRSTGYLNINDQCWNCHNTSNGWLNITSNGGTAVNHSISNQCSNCHNDNNKLNVHSVPTGAFGGRWCLNCHNLTGKAPIDHKVDPAIVNISNPNYIHYNLNGNSDATNSSRICWGCHTNDSIVINGRVNSTSIPVTGHPDKYTQPRNCTSCHNNSNDTINFSAPQVHRHTWYAPIMKTPAVTYCVNCHAQDEMINPWSEGVYPPKTDNESSSHYGKNRSSFFVPLIGTKEYCGYCHQNESTVMGPFAKASNKVRSNHASQVTTPGCANPTCHRPGRMHEDTLTIPNFTEANIGSTCLACHNSSDYNFHNGNITCWDCHMGNVSNTDPTWIHPIQFIQYNGNFTGAKLTSATCYDCHKSTRVDSTISNLSGRTPPKVYNQAHSFDPINGTKWGDYWKYTPTTYEFADYMIIGGNGTIDPAHPFENIKVPSNDYMQLNETETGSENGGAFPYNRAEQQINGPPVPNWTSSSKVTQGTTTLIAIQDANNGNPAGSLKSAIKTSSNNGGGSISWNYSFYYKPNSTQFAFTNASVDYNINVSTARTQNIYFRLIKPSGAVVTLANASCCATAGTSGWVTLSNNSFAGEMNEDGSVTPYKIQLYSVLSGARPTTNLYTVYFDNIFLKLQEKVWNRYEIVINTTGIPVNGSSKLGMSYQVHTENATLMIYNRTSRSYEFLDIMDKGVFFDYVKDINSTYHINSTDGITGNVSVKFVDTDQSDTDSVSDVLHIRYLYVYTYSGLQYPCSQCHSPNKHYVYPTLGSPAKFNAGNIVNQSISSSGTWCQQCHWQGAANYSQMIQEYSVTRKPPENIPPEITGNATYAPLGGARDGTSYKDHTGLDLSDLGCFSCHGGSLSQSAGITAFMHGVSVGVAAGGPDCIYCHDVGGSGAPLNFRINASVMKQGIHKNLNRNATNSTSIDLINKACWACHGDGKEPGSHPSNYTNPWTCLDCHNRTARFNTSNLTLLADITRKKTAEHIQLTYENISSTRNISSSNCTFCHNQSMPGFTDTASINILSNVSHYADMSGLVSPTINCNLCHNNAINASKYNANITRHPAKTADVSYCRYCHNTTNASSLHSQSLDFRFGNTSSIHGGSAGTNFPGFDWEEDDWNESMGLSARENEGCNACHYDSANFQSFAQICENCHLPDGNSLFTGPRNRNSGLMRYNASINDSIPRVYSHTNYSSVNVANQSQGGASSCYGFGNMTCHGVDYYNRSSAGGYFAYNYMYADKAVESDASHFTNTIDRLPDTGDCLFCHNQTNVTIRAAWGNARQVNASNMYGGVTNQDCYNCHTTDKSAPKDFHAGTLTRGSAGGGNCSACHDIGGSAGIGRLINFTAANDTNAIHKNLNNGAASLSGYPAENKKCWACHGNGSEPSGHPANYRTPYTCVDCHVQGAGQDLNYIPNSTLLTVAQHYWNGTSISTGAASCYACHNRTEMMVGIALDPDGAASVYGGANGGNNSTSHYGKKRSDMAGMDTGVYCNYCHNTSTNNATFYVSDFNNTIFNHTSRATTPLCSTCHNTGRLHNSTLVKPVSNDSYCSACHGAGGSAATNNKVEHKSLYCTECHANSSSGTLAGKDIHAVKYLTQSNTYSTLNSSAVNCVTCHQSSVVDPSLGSFVPFKIMNPIRHSDNLSNGSLWGGYWTTPQTACTYCHNNTLHNTTPLGRILQWSSNYSMYGSIGTNLSCSDCHYKGDANYGRMNSAFTSAGLQTPPEITNGTNWKGISSNYYNHSLGSYDDQTCKSCHGSLLGGSANMSEFTHNAATGVAGGANCTACHNTGGSAGSGKLINFTAAGDANAIHRNLNSGANTTLPAENKKCWACHGNGSEPSGHPANYRTPYNCTDCHVPGAGRNLNYTPANILNVTQHYWNGTSIDTPAATSCYDCHNRSEMMLGLVLDPDGAATVYGGANGGNNSASHYGKKRTDYPAQGTNDYCYKCHNNFSATSVFPYLNSGNATIANHSISYPSSNPDCNSCHAMAAGRLHNDTLYKPAFSLPNSTYCLSCHGSGGSATIKNLERHNGTTGLNCTQCHLNSTKSIHPVRYLQQDSTWNTSKTKAVNCTSCHQTIMVIGSNTATLTPNPMNHSADPYSGALWNNTQPAYWINTSQQSSCDYCHGRIAYHNLSGLGNITRVKGGNTARQNLSTSRWCANCHYAGAAGYGGSSFYPEPPEILNASGKAPLKARDNTSFYNHSQDVAAGYNDSRCKTCHNNSLAADATSLNFSHNLAPGAGGPNCIGCHYIGAGVQNINVTAINDASSIHRDLNKGASVTDNGYNDSKKCWACHGDGSQPTGHPARYKAPYNCTDCHTNSSAPYSALQVSQHYWNGTSIRTPAVNNCYVCHNTTGMIIAAYDPDGASANIYGGANGGNDSVSHYGRKRGDMALQQNTTQYCDNCHKGSSAFPFIDNANRTIANHSLGYPATNPACRDCHDGGRIHNSTLYKTSLGQTNSTYCLGCHGTPGSVNATIRNLERHNGTGTSCTQCHLNTSDSIHPVRYLKPDNTWDTSSANAVNCTSCHQGQGMGSFGSAPKVPILTHSTNAYSGALWNGTQPGFWINTSQQSGCDYCHGNAALHNTSGLGNITKVKGSNMVRQGFTGGYWCANCHYGNAANYTGNQFTPQPPEVLNNSGLVPAFARDSTQFYNHSGDLTSSYDDAKCKKCHDNNLGVSATSLNFTHSLGFSSGGPNCTSCHGLGGSLADGKRVNHTAMNSSLAIHKGLNRDAQASDSNYTENKKCWACHGDGTEPAGHPARYKTPYNCVDCHVPGPGQNMNYNPNNTLLNVTQHYWNGTSIGTSAAASCYDCHNKSEMMAGMALDPDGAATVYGGANGGNLSVSHYGKRRNDMAGLGNTTYCNYCHNNQSGAFPFINNSNRTIANHSTNYASTNPACRDCHEAGRLHNSTLYKSAFTLSNGTYCLGCHGNNGSGGTNYTGAVTAYKEEHNNSLCSECHLNSTGGIHSVRYLRYNSTWGTTNGSAANCTTCHQGAGMGGFGSSPLVQTPIWHSNSTSSGALWNGAQPRFWDNMSQLSSCDYCHGKAALHDASALGKSSIIQAGNSKNQSLTSSYWCANCHYNGSAPGGRYNYMGNSFNPIPPEIMNLTGLLPANSSIGMPFQNHTTNIGGDFSDTRCKTCHGKYSPSIITSAIFVHRLNESAPETGGPDCLKCHSSTATLNESEGTPTDMRVNKTAFINYGVHRNMNSNATSTVVLSDNRSKACWVCHGDGTQPIKHHVDYTTPKPCIYCHVNSSYNATQVSSHYPGAVFLGNITYDSSDPGRKCVSCHNNSLVANLNVTFGSASATKIMNSSVSHYTVNRSTGVKMGAGAVTGVLLNTTTINGCRGCHAVGGQYGAWGPSYGNASALPSSHNVMGSTPEDCEKSCHNSAVDDTGFPAPVDLHNSSVGIYIGESSCYSKGCHPDPASGDGGGVRR